MPRCLVTHLIAAVDATLPTLYYRTACGIIGRRNNPGSEDASIPGSAGCGVVAMTPSDFYNDLSRSYCSRCVKHWGDLYDTDVKREELRS